MSKPPAAAQTALGPMVIAAVEQHTPAAHRLVDDELAARFLPPGLRFGVRLCKWSSMHEFAVRAVEKKAPGMWGAVLCRKRYADEAVREAIASGFEQVVILGAGLDTRAYRLAAPAGVAAFEVDLPENISTKRARLQAVFGGVPEHVTLVALDFQTGDLAAALVNAGFEFGRRTIFVWEAVTQYLTEAGFRSTLEVLSRAAAGSRLVFTYIRADFLDGTNAYGAEAIYRDMKLVYDVWHFGIAPQDVEATLAPYGWTTREQVGSHEYMARYVGPCGRELTVSEIERCVAAEKQ